jgi:hypothetical protein
MTDLVLSWRQNFDLSWRLKDCKHWRWMPGMLAWYEDDTITHRVTRVSRSGYPFGCLPDEGVRVWELSADSLPDLNDPATLGCLLALVREAHNAPHAWVETRHKKRSRVVSPEEMSEGTKMLCDWQVGMESEALVAALEAAP